MSSQNTLLVFGAGPRVGRSVASIFSQNGYQVALVGRSLTNGVSKDGYLEIQADLADSGCVPSVFQKVEDALGPPNIIVYNGWFCFLSQFFWFLFSSFSYKL